MKPRRTSATRWSLTLAAVCGCAGAPLQPVPGPQPLPDAWKPETALSERLPRLSTGEVVLNEQDGLSPDEAALLALDRNPRLRVLRAERGIARAELLSAGVMPNPRLDASASVPTSGADATVLGYGVGLAWNVTPLLSRGARVAAGEENVAAVDLEVAWQEWQVAQGARLRATRVIFLDRRIALAREMEDTWRRRLEGLRAARAAKAVTELEVTGAERSFAEARIGTLELEQQLAGERGALNQAIGLDASARPAMETAWSPAAVEPRADRLLDELPRRRLDLIALQRAVRSRDDALRAAVLGRFPAIEVGLRAAREVDGLGSAGLTLTFALPFFDRNQGNVAGERSRRERAEAEYDARLAEARAETVRLVEELGLVELQLKAATEASEAAVRLAELGRAAAVGGALSPLVAADLLERSASARLRALAIAQARAELRIALTFATGTNL